MECCYLSTLKLVKKQQQLGGNNDDIVQKLLKDVKTYPDGRKTIYINGQEYEIHQGEIAITSYPKKYHDQRPCHKHNAREIT